MPQCQGTTKAGARCKRDANNDSDFCGFHAEDSGDDDASDADASASSGNHRGTDLLLVGVVALGLLLLRRVLRF